MVSHGDEGSELPLLWQLCQALVHFGYSITVLDATTPESEANPGLEQLLENAHWRDDVPYDMPAWTVMPSAIGIKTLCAKQTASASKIDQLRNLVPPEGVIVLYCKVEPMTTLIGEWPIEPLLAVSSTQASLLTSYAALKSLLISGRLKPTIINMMQDSDPRSPATVTPSLPGLNAVAKRFLGYECQTLRVREQRNSSFLSAEIQSLALRLLESSATLGTKVSPPETAHRSTPVRYFDQFAEGH